MLALSMEFLDIQATIVCEFTLNAYEISQEHTVKCNVQISTHNTAQSFARFDQIVECFFTN